MKKFLILNGIKNFQFTNWAHTYSCTPSMYFEPNSYEEIKDILTLAKSNEKRVKCIGCGHSPSDIALTSDYMISMCKLDRIIDIDVKNLQIKVEAGCTLEKMNRILDENQMAMSVLGSISEQTIAGAISTGTHGSGANFHILSAYVTEIDMMLASGEIKTYRNGVDEEFKAVVCSLGSLGVILAVQFQCEHAFNLEQVEYSLKLEDSLSRLNALMKESDHFRMFWYPHTDVVICQDISRTPERKVVNNYSWFKSRFLNYYLLEFLYWLAAFFVFLVPYINKLYAKLNSKHTISINKSFKIFNYDCLLKPYVFEASIPRDETAKFLRRLKQWLTSNKHVKVHFPVEIRFVKQDDIWLSPAYKQDSCYLNIACYRPFGKEVEHLDYWSINEKLLIELNGRPHWAKAHNFRRKELERLYPKFADFIQLRNKLDPNGLFMNECLEKLFN